MTYGPNGGLSDAIRRHFPEGHLGFAVDVGASDGISVNTTYLLETVHHWTVLSIEANPAYAPALRKCRGRVEMCAVSNVPGISTFHINDANPEAYSSLMPTKRLDLAGRAEARWSHVDVPVRRLDELLEKWEFPRLDALCIDTEGTELDVLRSIDLEKWRPKAVVIEAWDTHSPADTWAESFGYERAWRSAHNNLYVLKESA